MRKRFIFEELKWNKNGNYAKSEKDTHHRTISYVEVTIGSLGCGISHLRVTVRKRLHEKTQGGGHGYSVELPELVELQKAITWAVNKAREEKWLK